MDEKINNVELKLNFYKGDDLYCDGAVEDDLLEIVKTINTDEFPLIVETSMNWPIMYHLSPIRENILSWFPFCKNAKILEIGSGCGAVSGSLYHEGNEITCIDLSKKRSTINAYRHHKEKMKIYVGNFEDVELQEKFDYVTMIGVLEYGGSYIHSDSPYIDFIKKAKSFLNEEGKMLIAIENKIGLKYFAGCKEDHVGEYFEGIEGYPNKNGVRTFTKKELTNMLKLVGFEDIKFYYPYPDYKFTHTVYTDQHLPEIDELDDNIRNFDMERMKLFDEKEVYNTLLDEGLFSQFSNSFLIEASAQKSEHPIIYAKYSQSNRTSAFQLKTLIINSLGDLIVYKEALTETAKPHLYQMELSFELLTNQYKDTHVNFAMCQREANLLRFSFVKGESLENVLQKKIQEGKFKEMLELIENYFTELGKPTYIGVMEKKIERVNIFGEDVQGETVILDNANIDAIFSNVKINDSKYTLFDYEWIMNFSMPFDYIKYRCLFYFIQKNKVLKDMNLYGLLGLREIDVLRFAKMEENFQNYIRCGKLVDEQLHTSIGKPVITTEEIRKACIELKKEKTIQVYLDSGEGYSEKNSIHISTEKNGESQRITFACNEDVQNARIDPMNCFGLVNVRELYLYDAGTGQCHNLEFTTNGKKIGEQLFLFLTNDPMLEVTSKTLGGKQIVFEAEILALSEDMACQISKQFGSKKFLRGRRE